MMQKRLKKSKHPQWMAYWIGSIRWSKPRWWLPVLFGLTAWMPAQAPPLLAQTGASPVWVIQHIQVHFEPETPIDTRSLNRQFKGRVYHLTALNDVRESLHQLLVNEGYYFYCILLQRIQADSAQKTIVLTYHVNPGFPVQLTEVVLQMADTSAETRSRLQSRIAPFLKKPYRSRQIKELFAALLQDFENRGFPLARLELEDYQLKRLPDSSWGIDLKVRIVPGDTVHLVGLWFPGKEEHYTRYLQRLVNFRERELYDRRRVRRYRQRLQRQDFIKRVGEPQLIKNPNGQYFLKMELEEAPATTLDGVVGYVPPPTAKPQETGYFTGLLNMGFRNLFGPGRRLKLFWQKQDRYSEAFQLRYREPFILGLPLHTEWGLYRLVRDTTYIDWQYQVVLEFPLGDRIQAFVNLLNREIAPDTLASRQLRLPRTRSFYTETGLAYDSRDHVKNPRSGIYLRVAFSYGTKQNLGPAYLLREDSLKIRTTIQQVQADLEWYWEWLKRQVLANRLHFAFIGGKNAQIQLPDLFWFGGANSVRGFREDQFFAEKVVWLNTEYRFLLGPFTRFFIFVDNAYFTRRMPDPLTRWVTGYGLGIRFPGPLGILQVDLGMERGKPFREGKIHVRLINEF